MITVVIFRNRKRIQIFTERAKGKKPEQTLIACPSCVVQQIFNNAKLKPQLYVI
jgi:hypothetical protein